MHLTLIVLLTSQGFEVKARARGDGDSAMAGPASHPGDACDHQGHRIHAIGKALFCSFTVAESPAMKRAKSN